MGHDTIREDSGGIFMKISNDIYYVGVNDHDIDLFEGQFVVENGMAYNSYVIMDEKIAIMDSVDVHFKDEWLNNIDNVLSGRQPDYFIVHHMEPDHSANISDFMEKYPHVQIISTAKSFDMMKQFYGVDYSSRQIVVKEKDIVKLGKHTLTFMMAPMVHWPEVMVSYDETDKVLFSADAFGKFGALDCEEDWACEARRYYFGIVGKYGMQAQALLKKASQLDIQIICPLHGPVLNENLEYYINLYQIWSTYGVESDGVMIAYSSVYGHTKEAVDLLAQKLTELGCSKVAVNDLAREDMDEVVEDAFRYGKIVLASVTYNAGIFPHMKTFIDHLIEKNFQNRIVAFIENGSWAPVANKVMKQMFEKSKNITFTENNVSIKSAVNDINMIEIENLAHELMK